LVLLVNLATMCIGIAIIGLSSYVVQLGRDYNHLVEDGEMLLMVPIWTLVGGLLMTIVSFFGCCGILRGSPCMLRLYGTFVVLLVVMELVCGTLLVMNKEWFMDRVHDGMTNTFYKYGPDHPALSDSIDVSQHELRCCGVSSYNDWFLIKNDNDVTPGCCTRDPGVDANDCYRNINELTPEELKETIYTEGCYVTLQNLLADQAFTLGILVIVLCAMQLVMTVVAFCSANSYAKRREALRVNYY